MCVEDSYGCDECGDLVSETFEVYTRNGRTAYVCRDCLEEFYTRCDICGGYHPNDDIRYIEGRDVCESCFSEHYFYCEVCEEYHHEEEEVYVMDDGGEEISICEHCRDRYYTECRECGKYYRDETVHVVYGPYGHQIVVCDECLKKYQECPACGEHVTVDLEEGEPCPLCGALAEDEKEEVSA